MDSEQERVLAELERVEAEKGRAHAESNDGTGRVEAEAGRVSAEELRVTAQQEYITELEKLQNDPEHYITPGARRVFRRYTYAWIILACAAIIGVWALTSESKNRVEDINQSRATITYTNCLDQNERNVNTIKQLDNLIVQRKLDIREQIRQTENLDEQSRLRTQLDSIDDNRASTVGLINALSPYQNCRQLSLDRFGFIPDIEQKTGGE